MKGLTNDIQENTLVERLAGMYGAHKNEKMYQSVMDVIVRANKEKFSEVNDMCNALLELMKDELDAREQKGISQGISQGRENLIRKKILKQKSITQIADELEDTVENILPIYNRLKEELL